jgi:hypothetical protein
MPDPSHRRLNTQQGREKQSKDSGPSRNRGAAAPNVERAFEAWTKDELYRQARQRGIDGRSTMSKQQLIDALRLPPV